jgi:sugar/nucleoside kinase (ribokinase family)
MQALFIGQTYIDVTFLTDHIPTGDEKHVAQDYAVSFGGNAVTAAFCCAKLGLKPHLLCTFADDWLGRMFEDMANTYAVSLIKREVARSSLSFIMPQNGKRAVVRCRDNTFLQPFPKLDITNCRALHIDGHQPDAALFYARACREKGILTSLDGGGLRDNTPELIKFIDVAVVSEQLCTQMNFNPQAMLAFLKDSGCTVGAVTMGERGTLWYGPNHDVQHMAALNVPKEKVIDTNGAGDIFHGSYLYSRLIRPEQGWDSHFRFARAASAHAIQYLGNEASIPSVEDVEKSMERAGELQIP